ncbi:radical SAM protein [uncultured Lacinutrix sp.]|uniref:B12-binding domain-containing radical SAM protein n=1 Tax=uncultured Lacinutrix sp. TaxID=574032 RepID=UPI0026089733|nr:radical SAM protein [uncultured Lacinutrix sp.]
MSIVLTHTYYLFEDPKEQLIMRPYAPLGLLYISSYLNENEVENHVYDSTFYSKEEQLDFIAKKQPKALAIYTNLMTKINVIKLVKTLNEDPKYGFPKIILGGPDITYNCENYLNTGVDFLIIGEGEQTMLELYTAIINNNDYSEIDGIAYLKDGNLKKTPPRMRMKSLKELPLPNRAAIPVEKYLETWKTHHGQSSMTVSTQRGCPYTCKWCSTAVYGQSYRRRPPDMVAAELLMLKNTYKPDSIWFVDDVFSVSHKWIEKFHEEVIKQGAIIPFECITRAERLNDEILQLLKEAGCFRIWIGAESGSQKIIDAMDRRVDVDVVKTAIQKTNALDIETGTFIMVGYPGEDEQDINETINYLKAANPTHFTITIAYPIKGTSLYNEIEEKIIVQPNWETSTDRDIDFKRTYPKKFYDFAVRRIVNEVNFNKELLKGKNKSILKSLKLKTKSIVAQTGMKLYKTHGN